MKLTKKLQTEILKVYNAYWDSYITGDSETMASVIDNDYKQIGSADVEVFFNKKDAMKFIYDTIDQIAGKAEMRNRVVKIEPLEELILVSDFFEIYVLIENEWSYYSKFRSSTLMQKKKDGWKFIHQHSSMPDTRTKEGENISIEKISAENLQLREAVNRRTAELEQKNRELEIETALERVRAVAMSMNKSDDLLSICEVSFKEFKKLGFDDIRNALIHIQYDEQKYFMDYDFSDLTGGAITKIEYGSHPVVEDYLKQIRSAKDAFYQGIIKEDQLEEWKDFRRNSGQIDDPRLNKATALYYYFFSIGIGDIGISTLKSIDESQIKILKRFRNVFDLAYRRYTDITKAEAQAREAEIETALEKVRAVAMSMNKPEDLLNICEVLYKEFLSFGFGELRNAMINIHNDEKRTFVNYDYSDEIGKSVNHLEYNIHPVIEKQIKQIRSADDAFSETVFKGEDLKSWKEFREKIGEKNDPRINKSTALYYYFYSIGTGSIGISTFSPIGEEKLEVLKRFRNVFKLSYQRYLDIALAEAQAKEVQIELALERVRARTMAMQKSDELAETAQVLFQQFSELGEDPDQLSIAIVNESEKVLETWLSVQGNLMKQMFKASIEEPIVINKIYTAWKKKKKSLTIDISGHELERYNNFRNSLNELKDYNDAKNRTSREENRRVIYVAYFSRGMLAVATPEPRPNEIINLLERFASVFDGTYTRFLDLQKAEAQARESQIELSLERVRARTMAMQRSDELPGAATILFQQVQSLGMPAFAAGYCIWDEDKQAITLWMSSEGILQPPFKAPTTEDELFIEMRKGHEEGKGFHVVEMGGKKLVAHYQYMRTLPVVGEIFDSIIEAGHPLPTFQIMHHAYFSKGFLLFITYEKVPEAQDIFKRFAKVFEQTYTRFLDLQKAEAQARESQIELSLERVRARTMAMQKSNELAETAYVLFQQFRELGQQPDQFTIGIMNEDEHMIEFWHTWLGSPLGAKVIFSTDEPHMAKKVFQAWKEQKKSIIIDLSGIELLEYNAYRKVRLQEAKVNFGNVLDEEKRRIIYFACFSKGTISISTHKPRPDETTQLLERFAGVFDGTYTRFLDLKKAEAQAREARIEAALERVRSRTMGMQKSEELKEVIRVVYDQFAHLDIHVEHTGFIMDYKARDDMHIWLADKNAVPFEVTIPYFDCAHWNSFIEAKEKGIDFFANHLTFEEKNKFYQDLFKLIPGVPEETLEYYFSCPGLAISTVLFENVGLYIENFSGTPYTDEENNTLMRFGKVFQQTYTRFNDLKQAEAQAKESQIEAALERVRSRTMAMHQSSELAETASVLFKQLIELGIEPNRLYIAIVKDETGKAEFWITDEDGSKVGAGFSAKLNDNSSFNKMFDGWKKKNKSLTIDMQGKELQEYFEHLGKLNVPFKGGLSQKRRVQHIAYFSQGFIGIASPDLQSEETVNLLERFAAVFNLTYRRFLDLQKAEAQARESQIEAALERVRAKAMAMHTSNDLSDTMGVLFTELPKLGISSLRCGVVLLSKSHRRGVFYAAATTSDSDSFTMIGGGDMAEHPVFLKQYENWLNNENYFTTLSDEELQSYYKAIFARLSIPYTPREHKVQTEHGYYFAFSEGMFYAWADVPYSEDEINVLHRFKVLIDLTFRRYFDLQKAEAQAREAQIETALERVRSRTMAMQRSEELSETSFVLFQQFSELGIVPNRFFIGIVNEDKGNMDVWITEWGGEMYSQTFKVKIDEPVVGKKVYEAWKAKDKSIVIDINGEDLVKWNEYLKSIGFPVETRKFVSRLVNSCAIFSKGFIAITTPEITSEETVLLLERFASVFDGTYTRFIDLKNAEAQAREAKIEASLERVRSKAMAMHSPNDLSETVNVFFKELKTLGIVPIRCGVGQIDEATRTTSLTTTTSSQQGDSFQVIGKVKQTGHPVLDGIFDNWKLQKEYYPVLEGEDIKAYYNVMNPQIGYPDYPEGMTQYGNNFPFKEGFIFAWTENRLAEDELQIFRRFSSVLSLTYRRYMDLKEAEARALESIQQASLDRVRAEIASMRTSEDLNRITPIIWRELKTLGVPFFRCGVYIIDEKTEMVRVYLTTPDGKSLGVLNLSFNSNEITSNTVNHWRKKQVHKAHWNKQEFINWTKYLVEQDQIPTAESYQGSAEPPEALDLNFVPFAQGMLYVGDVNPLSDDKLELVKSLAEAFSIAYARYEDFKNLEDAKNKIEMTLKELKSAQAQLIHSEKMASLGELTAGIAHEIKNPLNFVNNFSEVSRELLDEVKTEIQNKNLDEVIELIEDLKQNLEKINQHGKRADSIVKGMLLHSRGTSGEKVLTNINDLLDQYVTLAYHGLRAQNKEFNITIEKNYDDTLEKINVVPQDISRVFLNVINNACYAAFERKKKGENNFSPILKVSTKKLKDNVEIRISDNGEGIPQSIKKQIFNPFFTTKPTGEGTGLGLSLSYDIVTKVHGGNIKVESEEGKGAEFIIQLPLQ